jgi:hypothetical protein
MRGRIVCFVLCLCSCVSLRPCLLLACICPRLRAPFFVCSCREPDTPARLSRRIPPPARIDIHPHFALARLSYPGHFTLTLPSIFACI